MNDVLDAIIYYDELTTDQRNAVRSIINSQPELVQLFERWRQLKLELRDSLNSSIPDRNLLVLYALHHNKESYLTPTERTRLESSLSKIEQAMHTHPAFKDVVNDIQDARLDFIQLWEKKIESNIQDPTPGMTIHSITESVRQLPRRLVRIAAILLSLVLTYWAVSMWSNGRTETIQIADNEFKLVQFNDGSKVRLVGESQITYSKPIFNSSFNRFVTVDGKAFFDISPNERPFTVESATALTEATGTQFGISADAESTEVVLTNGRVTVRSNQLPETNVTLSPGQRSLIPLNQPPTPPEDIANITEHLRWTGLLVFHFSPLERVTQRLSDHFNVQIEAAPEFRDEPFKATFDPDTLSLSETLETLTTALGATLDTLHQEVYMLIPPQGP